jgi:hypothetical protein
MALPFSSITTYVELMLKGLIIVEFLRNDHLSGIQSTDSASLLGTLAHQSSSGLQSQSLYSFV